MTVSSRDKTRLIHVSVSRRNEEILDLVYEFADGKGMIRLDLLFYLSAQILNSIAKVRGGLQRHRSESCHLWSV